MNAIEISYSKGAFSKLHGVAFQFKGDFSCQRSIAVILVVKWPASPPA